MGGSFLESDATNSAAGWEAGRLPPTSSPRGPTATSVAVVTEVGVLLRGWRRRRGLSQLALAGAAGVSARHLSFVETGRSRPSRAMLLRLGEQLDVPLRDRNALLLAAGLAPAYPQRRLDDPPMAAVADAVARILTAYEPYPALVVDR